MLKIRSSALAAVLPLGSLLLLMKGLLQSATTAPQPAPAAEPREKFETLSYAPKLIGERCDERRYYSGGDAEAVKWHQIAAVQGSFVARAKVGLMYCDGMGVRKDLVTAYTLLSLVSEIEPGASEALEDLKDIFKPAQIAKAAKRANRIFGQQRSRSGGN